MRRTLGEFEGASKLNLEGSKLFRTLRHKLGIANAVEELGAVSAVQSDGLLAVMLLSMAHASREGIGAPLPPVDRAAHDSVVDTCRTQLGEANFARVWAEGNVFSLDCMHRFAGR